MKETMECRKNCGACCIAPSISAPIPGMPDGKKAMERCIHLDAEMNCRIFHSPERPPVCASLKPSAEMCGDSREEALAYLTKLEQDTAPEQTH